MVVPGIMGSRDDIDMLSIFSRLRVDTREGRGAYYPSCLTILIRCVYVSMSVVEASKETGPL